MVNHRAGADKAAVGDVPAVTGDEGHVLGGELRHENKVAQGGEQAGDDGGFHGLFKAFRLGQARFESRADVGRV